MAGAWEKTTRDLLGKKLSEKPHKRGYYNNLKRSVRAKGRFFDEVKAMYQDLHLDPGYHDVGQLEVFANHYLFATDQILAFDHDGARFFHRSGTGAKLYIFLHEMHYYTLKSVCAFLNERYYCDTCGTGYQRR